MALRNSAAPSVIAVFGLADAPARWLTQALRGAGVVAVHLRADLPPAAAHSVLSAVDAGVHLVSARRGMDSTFLEYWQLLAEMGRARFVAVHDLGPVALDVNEAAAIATRVLEEDVHPITMPLLDDEEAVVGVLDVVTGEQWFPDDRREAPRQDFVEAVEAEANVLRDEVGEDVSGAVRDGHVAVALTLDAHSAAGVGWLAAHVPGRSVPGSAVVLPGDRAPAVLVAAGGESVTLGAALSVSGTTTEPVQIHSLEAVVEPASLTRVPPGAVASARIEPVPQVGALLLPG